MYRFLRRNLAQSTTRPPAWRNQGVRPRATRGASIQDINSIKVASVLASATFGTRDQLINGDQLGSVASVGVTIWRSLKPAMSIDDSRAE